MNLQKQSELYWDRITTRRRNPVKGSTLSAYRCYLNKWIVPNMGHLDLSQVENGEMKKFVATLSSAGLSPAMIDGVTFCVKAVVASAVDENGNALYPRTWNAEHIDAPVIDKRTQKAPTITALQARTAIENAPGQFRALFALAAASGARISELRALRVGFHPTSSYWDRERSVLVIKTALRYTVEQSTKSAAGVREVDLAPEINEFLQGNLTAQPGEYLFQNGNGGPVGVKTAYTNARKAGVPGYHSFRRFRITLLRAAQVPEDIIQFWVGHTGKSITDRYSKLCQDIEARKSWVKKAGLGFDLLG